MTTPENDPFLTHKTSLKPEAPQQQNYGATGAGQRRAGSVVSTTGSVGKPSPSPATDSYRGRRIPPGVVAAYLIFGYPLAMFILTALAFAVLWNAPALPAMMVVTCGVLLSVWRVPADVMPEYMTGARSLPKLAGIVGISAGGLTGLYTHEAYLGPYFAMTLGRAYDNVVASSPAAAYADGGKIYFAKTSKVDTARAIGYMDGSTYCVAPVVDSGNDQARTVGFWAVGLDCCAAARGDFQCGAAGKDGAHGGVRLAKDGILERTHEEFTRAIQQAAMVNDLAVEPDPMLVRWVEDPGAEQANALLSAMGILVLGVAFYALLVFTLVVASVLATIRSPPKRPMQPLPT